MLKIEMPLMTQKCVSLQMEGLHNVRSKWRENPEDSKVSHPRFRSRTYLVNWDAAEQVASWEEDVHNAQGNLADAATPASVK